MNLKQVEKLIDEYVTLREQALYAKNNTCLSRNAQEERFEELMYEADNKHTELFVLLKPVLADAKKYGKLCEETAVTPLPNHHNAIAESVQKS
jgi:hypothetical protein